MRFLIVVLALGLPSLAEAARTWRVGPTQALTRLADAARLAGDGDTVEIDPGDYRGEAAVAVWLQRRLTLRARGGRVRLFADGHSAEGKAIWVLRNGVFTVEGIAFHGARVPDLNGAGIRFEGGELRVIGCLFQDNQMGLITSNRPDARLRVERSEFSHAAWPGRGASHLLYAGRIAFLRVQDSHFHHGQVGHLLKSRAAINEIVNNRLIDGEGGRASYEVDLPEGGLALLEGNLIEQSATTENLALIAFGLEGPRPGPHRLVMRGNTLRNRSALPARWVRAATSTLLDETGSRKDGFGF